MLEKVGERVSVVTVYNWEGGRVMPVGVRWQGRLYKILKLGYYHRVKVGKALQHVFSVSTETVAFRLRLDSESLVWWLEEVSTD